MKVLTFICETNYLSSPIALNTHRKSLTHKERPGIRRNVRFASGKRKLARARLNAACTSPANKGRSYNYLAHIITAAGTKETSRSYVYSPKNRFEDGCSLIVITFCFQSQDNRTKTTQSLNNVCVYATSWFGHQCRGKLDNGATASTWLTKRKLEYSRKTSVACCCSFIRESRDNQSLDKRRYLRTLFVPNPLL